jgi:hypothetical protein
VCPKKSLLSKHARKHFYFEIIPNILLYSTTFFYLLIPKIYFNDIWK